MQSFSLYIGNLFPQISCKSAPEMASVAATRFTKTLNYSSSPNALTKPVRIPQFLSLNQPRRFPRSGIEQKIAVKASSSSPSAPTGSSPGLYSAQQFELTVQNVDLVLEDVRPYLIADGGNVDVLSVEDGVISLKLTGHLLFFSYPTDNSVSWLMIYLHKPVSKIYRVYFPTNKLLLFIELDLAAIVMFLFFYDRSL